MVIGQHAADDGVDASLGVDHKGGTVHQSQQAADGVAAHHPVGLGHFPLGIRQQPERQAVPGAEAAVRSHGVGAHPEDHGAGGFELRVMVAEAAGLGGAARRVVLGVEVEDHGPAPELRQGHRVALVVHRREVGRHVSGLEHGRPSSINEAVRTS